MSKSKNFIDLSFIQIATNKIREDTAKQIHLKRNFTIPLSGDFIDINDYSPFDKFEIFAFTESLIE